MAVVILKCNQGLGISYSEVLNLLVKWLVSLGFLEEDSDAGRRTVRTNFISDLTKLNKTLETIITLTWQKRETRTQLTLGSGRGKDKAGSGAGGTWTVTNEILWQQ